VIKYNIPVPISIGFDAEKVGDALFKFFGPGTPYEDARKQTGSPVKGPWTNHCLKDMIANREKGLKPGAESQTKDPDGLCKVIALAGLVKESEDESSVRARVTKCVNTVQVSGFMILGCWSRIIHIAHVK
jgi:hypothetical protein